jgi:hypothetical protein
VPDFPLQKFPTVRDLSFAAIRQFSCTSLRSRSERLGPGAETRPLEAQYQDEFYRACYVVLDHIVYLTPEWTGKVASGRVDFQVKSVGWAIEFLRDGDRLDEHISRFQPNGKYFSWILSGEITDYILLDCRQSMPSQAKGKVLLFMCIRDANWWRKLSISLFRGFCRWLRYVQDFRFIFKAGRTACCLIELATRNAPYPRDT